MKGLFATKGDIGDFGLDGDFRVDINISYLVYTMRFANSLFPIEQQLTDSSQSY